MQMYCMGKLKLRKAAITDAKSILRENKYIAISKWLISLQVYVLENVLKLFA